MSVRSCRAKSASSSGNTRRKRPLRHETTLMADRIELTSRSYVDTAVGVAVDALAGEAPDALNTIVELAAALQDDTLANALNNAIAGKQPVSAVLSALAELSTTDFGVALLTLAG